MTKPLTSVSGLLIGRCLVLVTTATIAAGCALSDSTAPTRIASARTDRTLSGPTTLSSGQGPQACAPDAKLIGLFTASTADAPGTWWRLTKNRFDLLGV